MHRIRSLKTTEEVAQMRKAVAITGKAFQRVCGFIKPGVKEYEIEAEITHEFLRNGSRGHAYTPIIASGYNACVLHYITNDQVCQDGDVILMDFGCEYGGYASDLTPLHAGERQVSPSANAMCTTPCCACRTSPPKLLRPGTLLAEYHKEVGRIMESELIGLGLLDKTDVAKTRPREAAVQEVLHARHQPLPGPGRARCGPVERADRRGHGLHRGAGHLHPRGEAGHPPGEQHPDRWTSSRTFHWKGPIPTSTALFRWAVMWPP
jgi:Xaa-Pro aminopeptidase